MNKTATELVSLAKALIAKDDAKALSGNISKNMRLVKKGLRSTLRPLIDMIDDVDSLKNGNWEDPSDKEEARQVSLTLSELKEAQKAIQKLDLKL